MFGSRFAPVSLFIAAALIVLPSAGAHAQTEHDTRLAHAIEVVQAFTTDEQSGIPAELLARAQGIAVIPDVIRGGFILGARRGRGVLVVRSPNGEWSNPALITLTGGSIGFQIGVASADIILVFANERSVRNIADGRFTLGGDAAAVAGPLGRHTTAAVTFKAEVYAYVRSQGLYGGAAFEGARLDVDEQGSEIFYRADTRAEALGEQNAATPASARRFLLALENAALLSGIPAAQPAPEPEGAVTFPLGGAP